MRHTGLWTVGIAAAAAVTLAFSGAAWAQQSQKGTTAGSTAKESSSASSSNCVRVKGGDCIQVKGGSTLDVKAASTKK